MAQPVVVPQPQRRSGVGRSRRTIARVPSGALAGTSAAGFAHLRALARVAIARSANYFGIVGPPAAVSARTRSSRVAWAWVWQFDLAPVGLAFRTSRSAFGPPSFEGSDGVEGEVLKVGGEFA